MALKAIELASPLVQSERLCPGRPCSLVCGAMSLNLNQRWSLFRRLTLSLIFLFSLALYRARRCVIPAQKITEDTLVSFTRSPTLRTLIVPDFLLKRFGARK